MTIDALIHIMPFAGFVGLFWYIQLLEKRLNGYSDIMEELVDVLGKIIHDNYDNNNSAMRSRVESLISHIDQRTQQDT